MKLNLIIAVLVATLVSGCAVCRSKESGVPPKAEVSSPEWGSQKRLSMRVNSKLKKGAAHGRVKMTKDRTAAMLSRRTT